MTYDRDPTRWTAASPEEVPEVLRDAFSAGRNEGPSRAQMQSLALKIAAVSAGGAVAIGAAKAATTMNAATSAATWSVGKLAGLLALAGGIATGALVWQGSRTPSAPQSAPVNAKVAPAHEIEPSAHPRAPSLPQDTARDAVDTTGSALGGTPEPEAPTKIEGTSAAIRAEAVGGAALASPAQATASKSDVGRAPVKAEATQSARDTSTKRAARTRRTSSAMRTASASADTTSELELLRRAQSALRGRPREAFELTEQHRRSYPNGEFAQERDALAIQALLGAGEVDTARDLARAFIRAHPNSPHTHRFREAMGLR